MTNNRDDDPVAALVGTTIEVEVARIEPDPENLRDTFDEDDLRDLGKNMQQVGQLDEITVFPLLDAAGRWTHKFDLHDGERRWRAASPR